MSRATLFVIFVTTLAAGVQCEADVSPQLVWQAFKSGREDLKRCVFSIAVSGEKNGKSVRHELRYAVDFPMQSFRVDCELDNNLPVGGMYYRFLSTQDKCFLVSRDEKVVTVGHPVPLGAFSKLTKGLPMPPFDFRLLGIREPAFLLLGGETLPEAADNLLDRASAMSVSEKDGVVRVILNEVSKDENRTPVKQIFTFDTTKSYAPIEYELLTSWEANKFVRQSKTELRWKQVNDCWVIASADCLMVNSRVRLDFDWKSVNETIDDKWLSSSHLNVPGGSWLVDSRLGKPVVLGTISSQLDGESKENLSFRWWAVVTNIFLIIVFGGLLAWRRAKII